jgi:hypothetical protein
MPRLRDVGLCLLLLREFLELGPPEAVIWLPTYVRQCCHMFTFNYFVLLLFFITNQYILKKNMMIFNIYVFMCPP